VSGWPPAPAVVVATVRGSAQSKQSGPAARWTCRCGWATASGLA